LLNSVSVIRGTRAPLTGGFRNAKARAAVDIALWTAIDGGWARYRRVFAVIRRHRIWTPVAGGLWNAKAGAAVNIAVWATEH